MNEKQVDIKIFGTTVLNFSCGTNKLDNIGFRMLLTHDYVYEQLELPTFILVEIHCSKEISNKIVGELKALEINDEKVFDVFFEKHNVSEPLKRIIGRRIEMYNSMSPEELLRFMLTDPAEPEIVLWE